jgi:FixJ family two-component response regulator
MCPGDGWIAIVDDDESIRRSLARVLLYNGITARTFGSAEEYLSHVPCEEPLCLVLDVHLGGLSGFDLQDRLEAAGRAPPIVFITAMDDIAAAQLETRAGPRGFLRKPFATRALLELVRRYVGVAMETPA